MNGVSYWTAKRSVREVENVELIEKVERAWDARVFAPGWKRRTKGCRRKATKTLRVIVRETRSGKPADRRHREQKMGSLCSGINSFKAVALKPNLI